MKSLNQYIVEKLKIGKKFKQSELVPDNKYALKDMINAEIKKNGPECDLNHIDVSKVNSFEKLFAKTTFDGDISDWDVSHVTDMYCMFYQSNFTGKNTDFSNWDTSKVTDMTNMFAYSKFDGDVSNFKTGLVTYFEGMFKFSYFTGKNSDLSNWDVSNAIDMTDMFKSTKIDQDLSNWTPQNMCVIFNMFDDTPMKNKKEWWPGN